MQIFDPNEKLEGEMEESEEMNHISFDEFKQLLGLEQNFDPSAIDKNVLFDTPANDIVVSKDALTLFDEQIQKQNILKEVQNEINHIIFKKAENIRLQEK